MLSNKDDYIYPESITENFDTANFHIRYCLSFIKKYLQGDILEVVMTNDSSDKVEIRGVNTEASKSNYT